MCMRNVKRLVTHVPDHIARKVLTEWHFILLACLKLDLFISPKFILKHDTLCIPQEIANITKDIYHTIEKNRLYWCQPAREIFGSK
jgi:hypothetical protein